MGPVVRLIVSDTGDGITPEFLPYVFHRFRQEEGSISRKAGGLGLGLAVVRHLVELHGGNVSAESPGPGQGSTFTVDLPLAVDRRDAVRDTGVEANAFERRGSDRVNGEALKTNVAAVATSPGKTTVETNGLPLADVRVLLVEDDDDSRDLLSLVLERHGAEVVATSSSAEALDSFLQKTPDIVISDIAMSEEDGYALIRKLRSMPMQGSLLPEPLLLKGQGSDISGQQTNSSALMAHHSSLRTVPAIALTGYATARDKERALAAGYQLHLAKPVEPEDLVAAIVNLVNDETG